VLPYHKYTGPYNPLKDQLDENDIPIIGQEPYNAVDAISMRHDICYRDMGDIQGGKHGCDDVMLQELKRFQPQTLRERFDKSLVESLIGSKRKMGLGIIDWSNELADELHKPIRRKFSKRQVKVNGVDAIWAADLVDMQSFSRQNKGYKHILMIIDVFSKYGWAIPLKTKTGVEVSKAFKTIWLDVAPQKLWTDDGTEFINSHMRKLMSEYNVERYSTQNEEKSCVVERWNRTIKRTMWKYFTANNTHKYIDVLSDIVAKYNHTKHRSLGCTPLVAREPLSYPHLIKAYKFKPPVTTPKFKVGDKVRISKKKKTFEKGFTPNWTEEVFTIVKVKSTSPVTYEIEDTKGEPVKGSFYEEELQKSKQQIFRIEKVLRRRRDEVFVKWKGYNNSFNSWIPLTDLQAS